jgi:hypothetical protein
MTLLITSLNTVRIAQNIPFALRVRRALHVLAYRTLRVNGGNTNSIVTSLHHILLCLCLISVTTATLAVQAAHATESAQTLPQSVSATYKISRNGLLIGNVTEKFTRIGSNRYKIISTTRAEGMAALITKDELIVSSEGQISRDGLVPTLFSSARKKDTKRNFVSRFDWANKTIQRQYQHDGIEETESFQLTAGTHDRLSAMYQFMRSRPSADLINIKMSQGKEAELYLYLKQGEPILATRAGEFETIQYAREIKTGESKAEIWLAKSKNYLPVKIIFEDNKGNKLEQSLVDLVVEG